MRLGTINKCYGKSKPPWWPTWLWPCQGGFTTGTDETIAANLYEWSTYDVIPAPSLPVPAAPQTRQQMTQPGAWTPEIERRTQVEAYQQALRQRIAEAEREDSYSPDAVLTVENVERVTSNAVGIGAVAIAAGLLVLLLSRK